MAIGQRNYFQRWTGHYPTAFWHDSAEPEEIRRAVSWGATGITTNPVLVPRAIQNAPLRWDVEITGLTRHRPSPTVEEIGWWLTRGVVVEAAAILQPIYRRTEGQEGTVCLQVNPLNHDDAEAMVNQALACNTWAENLLIKIPVTAAGLVAIEELAARGVSTTATVSFTVPQVIQVAEAFRRGLDKAQDAGLDTARLHSYAVIMIGRLDGHLRDVVEAQGIDVTEEALQVAGIAVAKKASRLFADRDYESVLCFSSLRPYHDPGMVIGGPHVFTIPTSLEDQIIQEDLPLKAELDKPVDEALVAQLLAEVPDFRRAYNEEGMEPAEYVSYGSVVKTLDEFIEGYEGLKCYVRERLQAL
jgi:transaldolase